MQGQYGRLEFDAEFVGAYMRDAISRGGYRAALDYYGRMRARTTQSSIHRIRARGWLLGRLALDEEMPGWMKEARSCSEFDYITDGGPGWNTDGGAITRQQREEGRIVRIEPVDATAPTPSSVPQRVWTVMLALDAAGPTYSRAGLGAAVTVLQSEANRRICGRIRRDPTKYDPLDHKMGGAPRGHQRWIISDVDTEMLPLNEPHYYYDLTDEGKGALEYVRGDRAPWSRAAVKAAAGLAGKAVPDILEDACGLGNAPPTIDGIRGELGGLIRAWDRRKGGNRLAPTSPKDAVLADLSPASKWRDGVADVQLEHVLFVMGAIKSVHEIACNAKMDGGASDTVLRVLIRKVHDRCRKLGAKIVGAPKEARQLPTGLGRGDAAENEMRCRWHRLVGELPASVSDLYYCLSEYCKSRGLADDPIDRPLGEVLNEHEKAALAEVLLADPPPGYEAAVVQGTPRPVRAGRLSNGRDIR